MGALASALRSGSTTTVGEWDEAFIDLVISSLAGTETIRALAKDRKWLELDDWLQANESHITAKIHSAYVALGNSIDQ